MTEKKAREAVDSQVLNLIASGCAKAFDIENALKANDAAKSLASGLRPMSRVVDQSLQRLRKRGVIEHINGRWSAR